MDFVKKEIASAKVVVFSKNYCPYCAKAQKALKSIKVDYKLVELVGRPDAEKVQDALLKLTGGRSVPRVFVNGTFYGGGDETAAGARNGKLQKLLAN